MRELQHALRSTIIINRKIIRKGQVVNNKIFYQE